MAASRDNPRVDTEIDVEFMPISTAATARIGDLLEYDTTNHVVTVMNAVADSTNFCGVAGANYPTSTDSALGSNLLKVYKRGVFEFDLTTTNVQYHQDDEFRWAGTAGNKVELSTSNPIGRVWQENVVGDTVVRLRIDKYVAY